VTSATSAPDASAGPGGLERAQVSLARFDNQLVERAPVANGALEFGGYGIRHITHDAAAPAPRIEDIAGVLLARRAR
jgi:hypothetical protein